MSKRQFSFLKNINIIVFLKKKLKVASMCSACASMCSACASEWETLALFMQRMLHLLVANVIFHDDVENITSSST